MKTTTKADLRRLLKILTPTTVRMIAIEIGLIGQRRGHATQAVTVNQLADHLHATPPRARQAAAFLRGATKDPRFLPAISAIEGLRGVGPLTVGGWTVTPEGLHRLKLQHGERAAQFVEFSTDARIGLILLDRPDAVSAVPLGLAKVPKAVAEALPGLILPPPPNTTT